MEEVEGVRVNGRIGSLDCEGLKKYRFGKEMDSGLWKGV